MKALEMAVIMGCIGIIAVSVVWALMTLLWNARHERSQSKRQDGRASAL